MKLFVVLALACGWWARQFHRLHNRFPARNSSFDPRLEGERFPMSAKSTRRDLKRMRLVTQEEAWSVLKGENKKYQFTGDWQTINPR
jgi:hypothetical protein